MTKQLPGGRIWTKDTLGCWDSEDGTLRIFPSQSGIGVILISFEHEGQDGEFWTRQFPTVEAAMEYAEIIPG
jgi:hypothetical protein